MKHHIDSKVLKDFKKVLWDLKLHQINFKFIVDGNIEKQYDNIQLVNYGMIQTDKNGKDISSTDSSYYYARKRGTIKNNDKYEYYQFLLCLKKTPSEKYYIINRDLQLYYLDNGAHITWTSVNGQHKEIIVSEMIMEDE